ncbi:MAG: NAD-dependent epimerase/dehydratase family protein [Myxococcales bacterium]|jgi:UDP-glucose 4-epimerase
MSFPLVWVVGAGGLLGSALLRELGADGFRNARPFTWTQRNVLRAELEATLAEFGARVAEQPGRPWAVAWCAGLSVVGTDAAQLASDTDIFQLLLELLAQEPKLRDSRGAVLLASSAGGVYAGCGASPIGEHTPPAPSSPYGREKLAQEHLLLAWANRQPAPVSTLIARVSNVYGPGQRLEKQQGLISHLARCSLHDVPVHVYVSLDTVRDYLFADDAGRRLKDGLVRLLRDAPGSRITKIYASEREISIAGLLGIFRHIADRPLRVVFGLHPVSPLQPAHLQFRSQVWLPEATPCLELAQGMAEVYRQQRELFVRGELPAPPVPTQR